MSGAEDTSLPPARWGVAGNEAAPSGTPPRRRLFRKYALLFIALVGAALLVNSSFDFWFSYQENKASLVRIQQEKAAAAARRIEEFIGEIERQIGWTTHAQWASGPLDQRLQDYFRLLRQEPPITELSELDGEGKEQLQVSRLKMDVVGSGADFSQSPAFTEAKAHHVWFSPVYFRKESEPYMTLAMAREGKNAGVTVAEINLKLIWDVITGLKIGENGYAYVVDERGHLIANPDISLVLRDTDLSKLPQVAEALRAAPGSGGDEAAPTLARNLAGRRVLTAHAAIQPVGWRVFVEVPLAEALAPLYDAALRTLWLLLFGLIAATLVALVIARRMTGPIRAIAAGAERIGAGEFERRIEIHTGDELEALAEQFNRMGADLQKSYAELEQRVTDRTAELSEALDQQTATAEVLGVINSSPGDLAPVFEAMLQKATELCEASFGVMETFDGERLHTAATYRLPAALIDLLRQPFTTEVGSIRGALLTGAPFVRIADDGDPEGAPLRRAFIELGGARASLAVALRKDDQFLGVFWLHRQEVRPFTDKQIALLQNFAAQAVIAMENARLITETREALEQQTATAEVLGVINSSPGDLAPVFDAILEKAHSLCGAAKGALVTYDGEGHFHAVATHGLPAQFDELMRQPFPAYGGSPQQRLLQGERLIHIPDQAVHVQTNAIGRASVELAGTRTLLFLPLRKDDTLLGYISAFRQEVRPFSDKQIALLQNFAAQAVIAMENARLITETREALEQQTATAEVLGVINSSPGDLAPVFESILEKAHTLCGAAHGTLTIYDGECFRAVATHGLPEAFAELLRQPHPPSVPEERLLRGERFLHIPDVRAVTPGPDEGIARASIELTGTRTLLFVPLRKDDALLGHISAYREEVRPFSDKQIALLQNFAAQAVIAMENARLITETREALDQQTATAEVLQVINASPGDLAPVFDAILEKAHILCGVAYGSLQLYDGEKFRAVALHGHSGSLGDRLREGFRGVDNPITRPLLEGARFVHIADLAEIDHPVPRAAAKIDDVHTALFVPLRKDDALLGMIVSSRQEIRPFSDKEIALLQNFAAQAVIAMENARLITETREALDQQTATAEVLGVINSSPGNLAPVFDAILEKAHSLCGAEFGALLTYDGEFLQAVAWRDVPEAFLVVVREPFRLYPDNPMMRLVQGEGPIQISDLAEMAPQTHPDDRTGRAAIELGRVRTHLIVPLRKDAELLGIITANRREVRPFTDKQIALLQNFAAQAVIAMENARLITETREALDQQTATAEVLGVINSSPGDLAPVFEAMLEKATELCDATFGFLDTYDGEFFHRIALRGATPEIAEFMTRTPHPPGPDNAHGRLLRGEPVVHIADIAEDEAFLSGDPLRRALVELGGRTLLAVPLRREGVFLGDFIIFRKEVRPFSDKQIALLQNFAAQAVIAMENARLITETREALEQQTATAEVLGVINSSPGDLAPVFDAMLEKALRLCEAAFGNLRVYDGKDFRPGAMRGLPPRYAAYLATTSDQPAPGSGSQRALGGEDVVHVIDLMEEERYRSGHPYPRALVDLGGARSSVVVALRKDSALLGTITVYRQEVRPFSDKQIALLQNFAAQAVIAMENARLITETREALDQQTATAEVLQVINASPGDLAPVFDVMLEKAVRLCEANHGTVFIQDGDGFRAAALRNVPEKLAEYLRREPHHLLLGTLVERAVAERSPIQTPDAAAGERYRQGLPIAVAGVELGGARTTLTMPLLKDDAVLGILQLTRQEVRPFSDKQVALVENFAAQAVIAMENARLITETREALDQQTATAEVLQVINSSPGDLAPVFDAILEKAHSLCGADHGNLTIYDGQYFRAVAMHQMPEALAEQLRKPYQPYPGGPQARLLAGERLIQIPDEGAREATNPVTRASIDAGVRTLLFVPLRRDDALLGYITAFRKEVRPFTDKQIALLQNFAAQAVIAMENARLITETREALEQQTATAEVLGVINSSPGDLAPVFEAMLDKAMDLCGAAFGTLWTFDGESFHAAALHRVPKAYADFQQQGPIPSAPDSKSVLGQLAAGNAVAQTLDAADGTAYRDRPAARALVELGGARTVAGVPLRKDAALLGAITIYRQEVRAFSDKQIALLQNFAAQAVIAMENARLITETREALEQQTATAEVLGVINSSPGDLAPVFNAILEKAHSLCGADYGALLTYDGERFWPVAGHGGSARFAEVIGEHGFLPPAGGGLWKLTRGDLFAQIDDVAEVAAQHPDEPFLRALVEVGGIRTQLVVPLRKDGALLGALTANRYEVRPFSDKQIALLQNFAAQAVIAMENARLITETREALDQQTATAEVLGVINSSPGDLKPVFEAILEKAHSLCEAPRGALILYDGEHVRAVAVRGFAGEFADRLRQGMPGSETQFEAPLRAGERFVHIPDQAESDHPTARAGTLAGTRTLLTVPLRKGDALLGVIVAARAEVRPFTDKQIALLENFAAQAVIAMDNARLITETREALEQQTATAEVLGVINSSPGDLAPVFDAMLDKAMRLGEAAFGMMHTYDGERFNVAAMRGVPEAYARYRDHNPAVIGPGTGPARILGGENLVHIADLETEDAYRAGESRDRAVIDLAGARSILSVALRREDALLGMLTIFRQEVRPFSGNQIKLLQNFAAQAVIAMENARLITETREALEQQTATAEVLGVINSSPGDLAPVFEAMLERGMRLCEAAFGLLQTYDGEYLHPRARRGVSPALAEFWSQPQRPLPGNYFYRLIEGEDIVHVEDITNDDAYRSGNPIRRALADLGGARTALWVALRKDKILLGVIVLYRQEARLFTDKQVALLQNFAAQAVIAMENARLITETREALDQQTATAEVLQVINSSPGNLAPVFDAMLEKAINLCDSIQGTLWTFDGERSHLAASRGLSAEFVETLRENREHLDPGENDPMRRIMRGERLIQILDPLVDRSHGQVVAATAEFGGFRTIVFVALVKDGARLGAFAISRREVRPFTDKQIALLQNFAAQAVIAMENARLITETREALEQQTATAEVLGVINSSPGDLAPVFDAMLEKARALCEASFGILWTYDGERFHASALHGVPAAAIEFFTQGPHPVGPENAHGRLLRGDPVVHIADAAATETYRAGDPLRRALVDLSGARTVLGVPLRKDDAFLGAFIIYRQEVRPFTDKQIALLQNFAAQAVIAMENARLLTETRERTRDLQESLEYQTATSDVLKVISRSTFDLDAVMQTVVSSAMRLCQADHAGIYRNEKGEYRWASGNAPSSAYLEHERDLVIRPGPGTLVGRAALEGRAVHIADAWTDPLYEAKDDAREGGVHTMLGVPLMREGSPIGVIGLARKRVELFTDKQIELVTTFADQAVIAIENARLLGELRERTADLARSVEELKALGEVGQEVSSSLDLRHVLVTVLNRSVSLTGSDAGAIFRYSRAERAFHFVDSVGWDAATVGRVRDLSVGETVTALGDAIAKRAPLQVADLRTRPANPLRDSALAAGFRSALIVPLVGADRIMGVTILERRAVGEFPEATVRLMQTLASQSVLAIQNARLFREIAGKSEELAQASEHKSQFLANMSHELRTPLNAILGYTELMVDGIYGELPPRAAGVLERVQNNGKHLLALINDVLDLAKIEAGQLTLTLEDYAMPDVVQSVVSATEGLASTKGLKFIADIMPGLPPGHGDARRLSQVLLNLVGNAVKFTDEGEVAIGATAENGNFVLTVRDTGPGVAPEDQDKIFGEFQQVDNSNTRKKGGTGLGLAISKRMVEMHGGTIAVESEVGHGATFRVVLPIRVEDVADELTGELMGAA